MRSSEGKLLKPREDWYLPRMASDFAWLLFIDCEDENGLYAFQTDTSHLEIVQDIRNRASPVKVMDCIVGSRSAGGI